MTLLAPWYLAAGVAAALGLVGLHLLAVGRPPELRLPTARFVPERPARAVSRATVPADRVLLLARVLVALLAGLAFARPARTPARRAVARVIVADRSRAVVDPGAVRRAVDSLAGAGDVVIPFDGVGARAMVLAADSSARRGELDSVLAGGPVGARGGLSAALAAARRAAPGVARGADSLELVVVSPLVAGELDAATAGLRRAWGGRAVLVRVGGGKDSGSTGREVRVVWHRGGGGRDDALAAAVALRGAGAAAGVTAAVAATVPAAVPTDGETGAGAGANAAVAAGGGVGAGNGADVRARTGAGSSAGSSAGTDAGGNTGGRGGAGNGADARTDTGAGTAAGAGGGAAPGRVAVRVVRDGADEGDRAWAREAGHVLVDWPAAGPARGWEPRARPDTAGAVVAGGEALVAPLARAFAPRGDALRGATVVARWADGEPAAVERAEGAGCVRDVAVPVPQVGDVALSPAFARLLDQLTRPCDGASPGAGPAADAAVVASLAGSGPLLAARPLLADAPAPDGRRDRLPAWLLGAALALLVAELPLRRLAAGRAAAAAAPASERGPSARAA